MIFFDKQGHMPNRNPWPQWVCLEPTCSRGATIPTNGCYWAQVTGDPTRDWLLENCGFFSVMKSSEFKIMLLTCCCRIYICKIIYIYIIKYYTYYIILYYIILYYIIYIIYKYHIYILFFTYYIYIIYIYIYTYYIHIYIYISLQSSLGIDDLFPHQALGGDSKTKLAMASSGSPSSCRMLKLDLFC